MIVVMPDERTKAFGSFYVNSAATGNWADFTAKDLVGFVDGKYRTLANAKSRGIAGHSMGGYGAITLGMKHPEVFSVIYGMNPAIMGWAKDLTLDNPAFAFALAAKTPDDLMKGGVYSIATLTVAQAFSPNPNRAPFYADFPFENSNGKLRPIEPAFSRWEENFPVKMVQKYRTNLLKLRGLRFDSGYEDEYLFIPANSRALSAELTGNGIEHIFEEYNGDHRNRLHGRTGRIHTEVMPYFWLLLESRQTQ
jgi:S-formylglutathione hydrolase FrmB